MSFYSPLFFEISRRMWGPPLLILLLATGCYLTFLLRGIQFRYLFYSLKLIFTRKDDRAEGDISQFQALMTALSATIGIGSIAGVATAVTVGGLGALFWMWIVGFIGMATKYAESILAVKYRVCDEAGEMCGGPMYYLSRASRRKGLAILFAVGGAIGGITTGNMVQANSIADALGNYLPIDPLWVGVSLAVFTAFILLKGIKNIAWVAEYLVPVMASLYIFGGIFIIFINYQRVPEAFLLIVKAAFCKQAAFGGFLGSTMMTALRMGIVRGVFSNEAGLGTSSIASAAAKTDQPGRQAMISMSGAFIATFIVCTVTGLVIATTNVLGAYAPDGRVLNGASLVITAFNRTFPGSGLIVTTAIILFGYTTILGWAYYGEKCFEYLLGRKSVPFYRVAHTVLIIFGAKLGLDLIWSISDISNALMAFPNLLGLLGLAAVVKKESDAFLSIVREERIQGSLS